jgi:MraZ protein
MINLVGEYDCKLDGKNRVLFPSGLKKQLPEAVEMKFVVNRGFEQCLVLYPKSEWEHISNEVNQLSPYSKKSREFTRYFYRGASEITLDSSNRILLPKNLLNFAGIDKDIVLFAYSNKIEIWDKTKYESLLTDEPEDFATLAEEVMCKKDNKDGNEVS